MEFSHYTPAQSQAIPASRVTLITGLNERSIIFGTAGKGAFILNPESGKYLTHLAGTSSSLHRSLTNAHIDSLSVHDDKSIWIGARGVGLVVVTDYTSQYLKTKLADFPPQTRIEQIVAMENGDKWIATDTGLMLLREDGKPQLFTQENSSFPNNSVVSLSQLHDGSLWVGTHSGISIVTETPFSHFSKKSSDIDPNIMSFTEDEYEDVWVGTYNGVFRTHSALATRSSLETLETNAALHDKRVMALIYFKKKLLLGHMSAGISALERGKLVSSIPLIPEKLKERLSTYGITSLLSDRQGQLWIGTFGEGILRVHTNATEFTSYKSSDQIVYAELRNRTFALIELSDGTILAGTEKGLALYDETLDSFTHIVSDPSQPGSLSADMTWALREDHNGNVWIGTQNGGLNKWSYEHRKNEIFEFTQYSYDAGLPSSTIYAIEVDNSGNIWLSTNMGITRFNPTSLAVKNFDETDGLQGNEFNLGASLRSKSGLLYFGGNNGYNMFDPEEIERHENPPLLVLTRIEVAGETRLFPTTYDQLTEIVLDYQEYVIAFEFSTLDFKNPRQSTYKYRLIGLDDDWIDIGTRNSTTFTNLAPGEYVLRIIGADSDGNWNLQGISLPIIVHPPPWLTPWAYAAYTIITLALAALLVNYLVVIQLKRRAEVLAEQMYQTASTALEDLRNQVEIQTSLAKNMQEHSLRNIALAKEVLALASESHNTPQSERILAADYRRLEILQHLDRVLFTCGDKVKADFSAFIEKFSHELASQFNTDTQEFLPLLTIEVGLLPTPIAVPCALLLNELLTNSIQHAFPQAMGVQCLSIDFRETPDMQHWSLHYSDHGRGLPDGIDPYTSTTPGLTVVRGMAARMNAQMVVSVENGLSYKFLIPREQSQL